MSYTISEPNLDAGRDEILRLWDRNLPEGSAGRYDWLYDCGESTSWLVEAEDRSVVGSTGLMQRTLNVDGQIVHGGQAVDLNVDREHRTVGAAVKLQRAVTTAAKSGPLDLIYGLPNAQSEPVLKRVGYRPVGSVGRWAKPLQAGPWLENRIASGVARKAASALIDPAMLLGSRELLGQCPAGYRTEVTDRFDSRFDLLWQDARSSFPVIGQRNADYLNWRLADAPDARYRVFTLADDSGRLVAYLAFCCRRRTVYIADFLFVEPGHFECLLREFLRLVRRQGHAAVVVEFFGAAAIGRSLSRFGFWRRPAPWNLLVFAGTGLEASQRERVFRPDAWFLTRADVDTDF